MTSIECKQQYRINWNTRKPGYSESVSFEDSIFLYIGYMVKIRKYPFIRKYYDFKNDAGNELSRAMELMSGYRINWHISMKSDTSRYGL